MNFKRVLITLFILFISTPALSFIEVRKEYYPNGKLKAENYYKKGTREGTDKYYYEKRKEDKQKSL